MNSLPHLRIYLTHLESRLYSIFMKIVEQDTYTDYQ